MRLYRFAYLLALFFISSPINSFCQNAIWASDIASSVGGITGVKQMVVDKWGNTYVICYVNRIGIAKYNKNGQLVWLKKIETQVNNPLHYSASIDIDPSGNVIIAGTFETDADFDPGPGVVNLTTAGYTDFFVEKLDSSGAFKWVRQFGNIRYDYCTAMKTDKDGNIIIAGRTEEGNIDFDPGPGVFTGNNPNGGMYICKLSNDGNLIKVERFGTEIANSIDIDAFGDIVTTGIDNYVMYVMKVDKNLNLKWEKHFNSTNPNSRDNNAFSVKSDLSGNIYFIGVFRGTIDADPGTGVFNLTASGSQDLFLIKLNRSGDFILGKHVGGSGYTYATSLAIDSSANLFLAGNFQNTVDFDPGTGISNLTAANNSQVAYLLKLNFNGEYLWADAFYGTATHSGTLVALDKDKHILVAGNFNRDISFPTPDHNRIGLFAVQNPDIYIAKLADVNNVFGNTYFDSDSNGVKNGNEFFLPGVVIRAASVSDTFYTISDFRGIYNMLVDTGSYTISIPQLPLYYSRTLPATQSAIFGKTIGFADTAKNFGLVPIKNKKDLQIKITSLTAARPGFKTVYRLTYKNIGTTVMSGSIVLQHATKLSYVSAKPVASSYANPAASWNFTNLLPLASSDIDITFNVPVNAILDSSLMSTVTVNPVTGDETPINNRDTINHLVTFSYDPNDKTVNPNGNISPAFVSSGKYLDYIIRFQNTGTDTAINITISDTLSKNLDISSLELIASSHPCTTLLSKAGNLEWIFNNILLPDSNHNELMSHGFVRYRIKPKSTLILGDQIHNQSHIYFDYNEGVVTNNTLNIVAVAADTLQTPIFLNVPQTICSNQSINKSKLTNPPAPPSTITIKHDGIDLIFNKTDSSFTYDVSSPGNHTVSVFYGKDLLVKQKDTIYKSIASTEPGIAISSASAVDIGNTIIVMANLLNINSSYSINWTKNGKPIASTTTPSVSYTKEIGMDTISAILILPSSGCYTKYSVTSNNQVIAAKDSSDTFIPFIFYPNPFKSQVSIINIPDGKDFLAQMIDVHGRILSTHLINTAHSVINASNLNSSVYFIKIFENDTHKLIVVKKIIKL